MVTISPNLTHQRSRNWARVGLRGFRGRVSGRNSGSLTRRRAGEEISPRADADDNWAALGPPLGGWPKRALDIAVALFAISVFSPLIILAAALIKLTMGGPIIYAHLRVGHNGKMFRCFKFRTMVLQPDDKLIQFLASHPEADKEWRETQKLKNDPRVTFVGHILRISSLDELPQLINVLRGDMSCVGPRPIVAAELDRYGVHTPQYLSSRPGLTGLWQVSGRSRTSYARRVALDCEYVRSWSMWLDLKILLKTVPAVLNFRQVA